MCFQYIVNTISGKVYLIEINARFGGGCIVSLDAGFDMVGMILQEYIYNKKIEPIFPQKWTENFYMSRYFGEYCYVR